ncbi:hypothetical protein LH612_30635, partial [Klebsiella pneumoniae]|nr:hypothetical protein [Klebsiella pneumoniae]
QPPAPGRLGAPPPGVGPPALVGVAVGEAIGVAVPAGWSARGALGVGVCGACGASGACGGWAAEDDVVAGSDVSTRLGPAPAEGPPPELGALAEDGPPPEGEPVSGEALLC